MSSALEDIKSIDLDQWLTLATAPSPTKLQPGQTPYAYNTWVDEKPGSVITANGYLKVGTLPSGNPGTFSINYFNTTAGTQTYVVSDNATVWTTIDFQTFTPIITGLSQQFQLRGAVIRDKLWLTNGNDYVRVFDGTTVIILNGTSPTDVVIQNIIYGWVQTSGISPLDITINYIAGGTAGAEVVTVNGSTITVQIQSGVSTAQQILTALFASSAVSAIIDFGLYGGGGAGSIAQTAPASAGPLMGGTPLAPKGAYIVYHDERVWLYQQPSARSLCSFSALSDAAANEIDPDDPAAWPDDNSLQISEGDADYGTGLLLYRGYLHFFKQYSIWRLVGYDEYSYSRVKTRASTGTRFNESLQIMDSLVHLIGIDGIYVFDGEETERISDIIDPATAEQTSFGFNQLQQPNQNNLFWETTATADWNVGTVPNNLAIANAATLQAVDNTQADFQAGPTQTNIDLISNPNFIQLSPGSSGNPSTNNVLANQPVTISGGTLYGAAADLTIPGNSTLSGVGSVGTIVIVPVSATIPIVQIVFLGFVGESGGADAGIQVYIYANGVPIRPLFVSSNMYIQSDGSVSPRNNSSPQTYTMTFSAFMASTLSFSMNGTGAFLATQIQAFSEAYNTSGQFVSRTLDLGDTPVSLGILFSDYVLNNEELTFQTQTSPDGSTWDAAVSVTNGGAIGSTPRRYIRWIANLTSDGNNTPVISDVWVGTLYESIVFNTGGNIFAWGAFAADYTLNGQTINFYYRGASTSAGVSSASWNLIVPGGALNLPTSDQYIQFKFEMSGYSSANNPPVVNSVTLNWIVGTGGQPQVLQNVASFFWRNRYWLSAAGSGASANNTILIRGKKTFNSPWQLKDWEILSFTRYLDNLYGTSSVDGSIYQLDTGYSKNGLAMDSIFETGDFTFKGFQIQVLEIMLETDRLGPYTLYVGTSVDQGNTWADQAIDLTPPATGATTFWKRINNLNITTDKIRVRFYTNAADQPWQVHTCVVYYKLSAQRGTIGT